MPNTPLADPAAERRLVTALVEAPELWPAAAALPSSDFWHVETRSAWERVSLALRAGAPVIPADYEATWANDATPLSEYVQEDARRVAHLAACRRALESASAIAKAAYAADPDECRRLMLEGAQAVSAPSTGARPIHDLAGDLYESLTDGNLAERVIPTLPALDRVLGVGLMRQTLTVVMARPSIGKSSLLAQISDRSSSAGLRVIVFSKEESALAWTRRLAFGNSQLSWQAYRQGRLTSEELSKISHHINQLSARRTLWIDASLPQTTSQAWAVCDELAARGEKPDLVIADHLRLFADRADNETHRLGAISWALKQMAKRLDCAVIASAQLSRGLESQQDRRPDLKDLRDSGEIEENADVVIALYRDGYYHPGNDKTAELIIRKNREGARNAAAKMVFQEEHGYYYELQRVV